MGPRQVFKIDEPSSGDQRPTARAIPEAMLVVHPEDPLTVCCDNQGCLDTWDGLGSAGPLMGAFHAVAAIRGTLSN